MRKPALLAALLVAVICPALADTTVYGSARAALNYRDDDAERATLATEYAVGSTLWRAVVTHFTPFDCNWPFVPPADAEPPQQDEVDEKDVDQDDRARSGALRLYGHMSRERGFPRSALLRCQCQYPQGFFPLVRQLSFKPQHSRPLWSWQSQTTPNFGLIG